MKNKVNIIIPSITISNELITCLKGINLLNYKDFINEELSKPYL